MKNTIYPCLWFDGQAGAAADLYCSVFKNAKITANTSMVTTFTLNGQKFMGLNGGPLFKPNPSISFFVIYESEEEIDEAWEKLLEGGGMALMALDKYEWSEKYGWVADRFGINWQLSLGNLNEVGQKFCPLLMFTQERCGKAREAMDFYTSIFHNSGIQAISNYTAGDGDRETYIKHARFTLNGQILMAMDSSGPHNFSFNEAVSLVVNCDTQEEIDYYWDKLTAGGEESMCGWLKDKYGISWQIVPSVLNELMNDPHRSERVMSAFMKMKKFDIATLIQA